MQAADSSLDEFLDQLASGDPVPGGGSVAALQAAMAAALLAMVSNLTIGRKRYAEVEEQVLAVRGRAEELLAQARDLVEEDITAYSLVSQAMALPRATDEEKQERSARLQEALQAATEPPLATMRVSSEVAQLARELVDIGNRSAVSDVGTALHAARAAYHAAGLNVEINLRAIVDQAWTVRVREEMSSMPDPAALEDDVLNRVQRIIRGDSA